MHGNRYQFQPLCIGFILLILPEVQAVHILIDETERVHFSRIHSHEWHCLHISAAKEGAHLGLIGKPLQWDRQQYTPQTMVTTYRHNLSDIELRHIATIGLQHDRATVVRRFIDVCELPRGYWVLAGESDVRWAKPTTGRWQR